jgi:hypothetical protein
MFGPKKMDPEAQEEQRCLNLARAAGAHVYRLSGNARAGGTRQDRGLPDAWLFFPAHNIGGWFECKSPMGLKRHLARVTEPYDPKWPKRHAEEWQHAHDQEEFGRLCELTGIPWCLGTQEHFEVWLEKLGVIKYLSGIRQIVRRP